MAILQGCTCGDVSYGSMGRPNCVHTMGTVKRLIFVPRNKADGSRNTIDLNDANIGTTIKALVQSSTSADTRWYPTPEVKNVTIPRSDTTFEEDDAGNKFKIEGVGGVYSVNYEFWDKDALFAILKELQKFGCSSVDMFIQDSKGGIWGIKDNASDTLLRGLAISASSMDAFFDFATATTVGKIKGTFDLLQSENIACLAVITSNEHGISFEDLAPLVPASMEVTPVSNTELSVKVFDYVGGTAGTSNPVVGLLSANFKVTNLTVAGLPVVTSVEVVDGTYTLTLAAPLTSVGDNLKVEVIGFNGYAVNSTNAVSL